MCHVCTCRLNMIAMLKALGLYEHFSVSPFPFSPVPSAGALSPQVVPFRQASPCDMLQGAAACLLAWSDCFLSPPIA